MRYIFTLLFFHSAFLLSAQVKIVKDNIACLYGVKHITGEWLIKPEYTLISPVSNSTGQFILLKDNKYGLADKDGRIILEPIYNYLSPLGPMLELYSYNFPGKPIGILDKEGKIIIPPGKYDRITLYEKQFLLCFKKNDQYLYKKDRLITPDPFTGITAVNTDKLHLVLDFQNKKKDRSFKLVLENTDKLDTAFLLSDGEIQIYFEQYRITRNDSTFLYDKNKKLLFAVPFKNIEFNNVSYLNLTPSSTFKFTENDLWGIANLKGHILVKPVYKHLSTYRADHPPIHYLIQKNGLTGFMSDSFDVTIPPEHTVNHSYGLSNLILLSKNNKTALFDLDANPLSTFSYTFLTDDSRHFLYDTSGIFRLVNYPEKYDTTYASGYMQKGKFIHQTGNFHIYQFNREYVPFLKSGAVYSLDKTCYIEKTSSGYTFRHNGYTSLYDSDWKVIIPEPQKIQPPGIYIDGTHFIRRSPDNLYGIVDKDENWVVPAENQNIILSQGYYFYRSVWIKKEKNKDCRFKDPMAGHWYLCQPDGTLIIDMAFDLPVFIHHEPTIVYVNNQCGVYDFEKKEFLIEPKYDYANGYFGLYNHSLLFDHERNFSVIRNNGTFVSDKIWNHLMIINRFASSLDLPKIPMARYSDFYIFMNETDTLAISDHGDTTTNPAFIDELIHKGNISYGNDPYFNHKGYNMISYKKCFDVPALLSQDHYHCPHHNEYPEILDEVIDYLLKNDKYDFKFKPELWYIDTGMPVTDISGFTVAANFLMREAITDVNYVSAEVKFCNENYVSFVNGRANNISPCVNLYRSYGYLFEFGLEDLFRPEVNIEDAMIISLTEAIHDRDDLFLNCHNPATIFDRTGKTFFFTEKGLHFTLRDEKYEMKEIIITWKKLKKYAPEKGIVADFVATNAN